MRIGIIGMGSIGQRHYRNLLELGYRDIVWWDSDPDKQGYDPHLPPLFNRPERGASSEQIFWDWEPDVVFVCTPPDSHTGYGIEAVNSGVRGLFIEKPLSDKLGPEEDELIKQANAKGTVTMVGCQWRWCKSIQQVLKAGPKSKGAALTVAIRPDDLNSRTSPLFDAGIHLVDLALHFLGPVLGPVSMRKPAKKASLFELWLRHRGGTYTVVFANTRATEYSFTVRTDWNDLQKGAYWHWDGRDSRWPWGFKRNKMYIDQLKHFMRCVETGQSTGNDLGQAAETLKLALGVG